MNEPKPEQPPAPIVLRENAIIAGKFYPAGTPVPFERVEDLPAALKPLIAGPDAPTPFQPSERDIYATPLPSPFPPLREDVRERVESAHQRRLGLALAQAKFNQDAIDNAHEQAARAAEPPQLYVKRGGEWGRVERATLKPGEHVFTKRENGQMESVGVVDSRGQPPPPELIL